MLGTIASVRYMTWCDTRNMELTLVQRGGGTRKVAHEAIRHVHSKLHSITLVTTKVHMVLRSFVVLTWMRDIIELM